MLDGDDLRSAFENAPIGIAVLTPRGVVTGCNAAFGGLLGRPQVELTGVSLFDVTHDDDVPGARAACAAINSDDRSTVRYACRFVRPDGDVVPVLATTSFVHATAERPTHLIMHVQDETERRRLEAELAHRAVHDALTGLPNRVLLDDRLQLALGDASRTGRPLALLYVDLDGFKAVNDGHGHAGGDAVLREFALRLRQGLRPGDTAARVGGDEFVVVCPQTGTDEAAGIVERVRAAAVVPFDLPGGEVRLGAAVGVHVVDGADAGVTVERVLHAADEDMYRHKRAR